MPDNTVPEAEAKCFVLAFRFWGDHFAWVLASSHDHATVQTDCLILAHDHLKMPVNLRRGYQLAWLRKELLEITARHPVRQIAYRGVEQIAQTKNSARAESEGVFLEVCAAERGIEARKLLTKQLKKALSFVGKDLKDLLGNEPYNAVPKINCGEAALTAIALLLI